MSEVKYSCRSCGKEFLVKYSLFKPGEVQCPYCGSKDTKEKSSSSCCGGNNSRGSWFT
ncbi:MAG: zinc ribbon domain-containing protein [Desulfotomaculum sp.]|nr:zinc ribbon domain-containing protein [Desulfotomaculum sp.]